MSLPAAIAVKYTEDEAEYVSLRPIVRQTFQLRELIEMILSVSGKDASRIQQLLAAGAVTYHGYRYWWDGFAVAEAELRNFLREYPDPDPQLPFQMDRCIAVVVESDRKGNAEITRKDASRKRWFRSGNFWEAVTKVAGNELPIYLGYSYERRADLYSSQLDTNSILQLATAAKRHSARIDSKTLGRIENARRLIWVCPRVATGAKS